MTRLQRLKPFKPAWNKELLMELSFDPDKLKLLEKLVLIAKSKSND